MKYLNKFVTILILIAILIYFFLAGVYMFKQPILANTYLILGILLTISLKIYEE